MSETKKVEVDSLGWRWRMGAALWVVCAQSGQGSRGGTAGVLIKRGGGQPRHRGGGRAMVWESRKGREDEAPLHRLSEGDVGRGLLLQLSQTQMTAPAPWNTHTHGREREREYIRDQKFNRCYCKPCGLIFHF